MFKDCELKRFMRKSFDWDLYTMVC